MIIFNIAAIIPKLVFYKFIFIFNIERSIIFKKFCNNNHYCLKLCNNICYCISYNNFINIIIVIIIFYIIAIFVNFIYLYLYQYR